MTTCIPSSPFLKTLSKVTHILKNLGLSLFVHGLSLRIFRHVALLYVDFCFPAYRVFCCMLSLVAALSQYIRGRLVAHASRV